MLSNRAPMFISVEHEIRLRHQNSHKIKRRNRKSKVSSRTTAAEEQSELLIGDAVDDVVARTDIPSTNVLSSPSGEPPTKREPSPCQTSALSTPPVPSDSEHSTSSSSSVDSHKEIPGSDSEYLTSSSSISDSSTSHVLSDSGYAIQSSSIVDLPSQMPGSYPVSDDTVSEPRSSATGDCSEAPSRLHDSLKVYCSAVHEHLLANDFPPHNKFPIDSIFESAHTFRLNDGTIYEPDAHISFMEAEVPALIFNICWSETYEKKLNQTITAMMQTSGRLRCAILVSLHGRQPELEAIGTLIQADKVMVTVLKLSELEDGETHFLQTVHENLDITPHGTETVLFEWKDLTPTP